MEQRKLILIISVIGTLVGYVLSNPLVFGICQRKYLFNNIQGCLDSTISGIGEPLLIFSILLVVILSILLFLNKNIFKSWLRFAAWWIPLSIILIVITPETSNSWMPLYFIGKGTVTVLMAGIFSIISLILIAWKTFAARKT